MNSRGSTRGGGGTFPTGTSKDPLRGQGEEQSPVPLQEEMTLKESGVIFCSDEGLTCLVHPARILEFPIKTFFHLPSSTLGEKMMESQRQEPWEAELDLEMLNERRRIPAFIVPPRG